MVIAYFRAWLYFIRGRSAKDVIGLVMFVRFVKMVNIIDNIANTVELERIFLVSTKNGACENEFLTEY